MNAATEEFVRFVGSWRFQLYLLTRLPSAYFAGVRVNSLTPTECSVRVPLRWFSQNPFRSIYFACLAMAGELATGLLAMAHLHGRNPPVSMLVTRVEGEFVKKATGVATFTCTQGAELRAAIEESVRTSEGRTAVVRSVGRNQAGELVATFYFTWSFKPKVRPVVEGSPSAVPEVSAGVQPRIAGSGA